MQTEQTARAYTRLIEMIEQVQLPQRHVTTGVTTPSCEHYDLFTCAIHATERIDPFRDDRTMRTVSAHEFHELRAVVILIIQRLEVSESCELCMLLYKPILVA